MKKLSLFGLKIVLRIRDPNNLVIILEIRYLSIDSLEQWSDMLYNVISRVFVELVGLYILLHRDRVRILES